MKKAVTTGRQQTFGPNVANGRSEPETARCCAVFERQKSGETRTLCKRALRRIPDPMPSSNPIEADTDALSGDGHFSH